MDKIYIVRSHFEDYDSTAWKIIGIFIDKNLAEEIAKKWETFYTDKMYIFNRPKNWKPEKEKDWSINDINTEWEDSEEYEHRVMKYRDIMDFKEIIIEEFDLNKDITLEDSTLNEHILSLMTQWDRNHKLQKIIK